jgi:hypothetical protein
MKINDYRYNLESNRKNNFLHALTWSETMRSNQNLTKFINEKNKKAPVVGNNL